MNITHTVLHSWVSLIHILYAEQVSLHVKQRGLNDFNWLIEDQAFLRFHDSAPRPPPPPLSVIKLSLFLILPVCRRVQLTDGRKRGGWVWSRIIRPQESLGLCKSFNPLWCKPTCVWHDKSNKGHETIFLITYRYTTYGNQSQNA
jgi:hypothetical protein